MPDGKISFDPRSPNLDTVRQIVVERLRRDASWDQLDSTGDGFAPYVEYVAQSEPERQNGRHLLVLLPDMPAAADTRCYDVAHGPRGAGHACH